MRIGIIVATSREMEETKKIIKDIKITKIHNLEFYEGTINKSEVTLVQCGMGKVNSARTAQILIDKFDVERIINIGSAGAINPELNIGDIVIGEKLVQYDFDVSLIDNCDRGYIQGIGKFIKSDEQLLNICEKVLEENKDFKTKIGTIGTADLFCSDKEFAKSIREEFGADCVEMEGAAIAQVCFLDNIPFLVIRGISDSPNGNNGIDYYTYCNMAAKQAAEILKKILI